MSGRTCPQLEETHWRRRLNVAGNAASANRLAVVCDGRVLTSPTPRLRVWPHVSGVADGAKVTTSAGYRHAWLVRARADPLHLNSLPPLAA